MLLLCLHLNNHKAQTFEFINIIFSIENEILKNNFKGQYQFARAVSLGVLFSIFSLISFVSLQASIMLYYLCFLLL